MLRQLTDGGEIIGEQLADPVDQIVGKRCPLHADSLGSHMVGHARSARRKDRQVAAAFPLQLELRLDRLAQHVIGDAKIRARRAPHRIREAGQLLVPELVQCLGFGGVVTVNVDDHENCPRMKLRWIQIFQKSSSTS